MKSLAVGWAINRADCLPSVFLIIFNDSRVAVGFVCLAGCLVIGISTLEVLNYQKKEKKNFHSLSASNEQANVVHVNLTQLI